MNVFRVTFFIFLNFLAFTESYYIPSEDETFHTLMESNIKNFDDFMSTFSNATILGLNSNEDETPSREVEVCSNLSWRFSRGLKWLFASNINLKDAMNVRFFLSSRKQPSRVEISGGDKFSLKDADFNIERRTVFIVHGYLSSRSNSWIKRMEEAFLIWGDVNVVVVDWSSKGKTLNYFKAAISTKIVGYEIARFLHQVVNATINLASPYEPNWGTLHLVGHSLGAHICGVAAHDFKNMQNNWHVYRITGLDPADPCFNSVNAEYRLDRDDAQFVDVIHTSESVKTTVGFGTIDPIGHADFYPNGGKKQPGCARVQGSIFDWIRIPKTPIVQGTCSHGRSYLYLTESLIEAASVNCTFWAHPWDRTYKGALKVISEPCDETTCTEMGIQAENYPHRGTFFVTASRSAPFCITDLRDNNEVRRQVKADYMKAMIIYENINDHI